LGKGSQICFGYGNGINTLHTWQPPVFHRDMKSLNLLVNSEWVVKVADMGLARFNTPDNAKSMLKLRGTYAYLAPEIFVGEHFTEKADVFSMGIILWEIACRVIKGRYEVPYDEFPDVKQDFMIAIKVAEQQRRPTIPAVCPPAFASLIRACLHQSPQNRPTAQQMSNQLSQMITDYGANPSKWPAHIRNPV